MFRKVKLLGLIIRRLLVLDVDVLPLGNDVGELLPLVGIDDICCFFMGLFSIRQGSHREDRTSIERLANDHPNDWNWISFYLSRNELM